MDEAFLATLHDGPDHILPTPLWFLHWGWLVVHVIAIPVVYYIGYRMGQRKASR
jgi:hypothetical protein